MSIRQVLSGIVLFILAITLCFGQAPSWWLGAGCAAGALSCFALPLRRLLTAISDRGSVRDGVAVLLILSLSVWIANDLLFGRLGSADHASHFAQIWMMEQRLAAGKPVFGWSRLWYAGFPIGYGYPWGANLTVIGVYWLGLGLLTLAQAYNLVVWASFAGLALATYFLGRSLGSRLVGVVAAVLLLTDGGVHPYGGWQMAMDLGVWPSYYSLCFLVLAVLCLKQVCLYRRRRDVGLFALSSGLALLWHPIHIFSLALLGLSSTLVCLTSGGWRRSPGLIETEESGVEPLQTYAKSEASTAKCATWVPCLDAETLGLLTFSGVLAVLIGSLTLVSLLLFPDEMVTIGGLGPSLRSIGSLIFEGLLYRGTWHFISLAGFLGSMVLALRRDFLSSVLGVFVFTVLLFHTADLYVGSKLNVFLSAQITSVEFIRLVLIVKPFWMLGAAMVLVSVFQKQITCRGKSEEPGQHSVWRAVLLGTIVVPVAVVCIRYFYESQVQRTAGLVANQPNYREYSAFARWIDESLANDQRFFRIAVGTHADQHDLMELLPLLDRPIVKLGWTPANYFRLRVDSGNRDLLRAINVRYVFSDRRYVIPGCRTVRWFGTFRLCELTDWQSVPFTVVEGTGSGKVRYFSDEEIELEIEAQTSGVLRLNVSFFPRWQATLNGEPIQIREKSLNDDPSTGFMEVDLQSGIYRFYFRPGLLERISPFVTLGGLALAALLALLPGAVGSRTCQRSVRRRVVVWAGRVVGVIVSLGLLGGGIWWLVRVYNESTGPWRVQFYNTVNVSGEPKRSRAATMDISWGGVPPMPGLQHENYSSAWETDLMLEAETTIRFRLGSDDGTRMYVDGQLLIDHWQAHPFSYMTEEVTLGQGRHRLRVEHWQLSGDAELQLEASFDGGPFRGLPQEHLRYPSESEVEPNGTT